MTIFNSVFTTVYSLVIVGILGACMGSFICCLSWRMLNGESVINGRSHCDSCGHTLSVRDLVPIVGFVLNKGKCRYCGEKLSPIMPVSEAICAVSFVLITLKYDLSLTLIEYLCLACILLGCACADYMEYIIPDGYILAAVILRLIFICFSGDAAEQLILSFIGGSSVSAVMLIMAVVGEKLLKKRMIGGGDIKLLFATGLYFGWIANLLCLMISCITGIVFGLTTGKRSDGTDVKPVGAFPWGPSISLSALTVILVGDKIIAWYMNIWGI